jgi:transcriptional regulator with XRE-family HTH domain
MGYKPDPTKKFLEAVGDNIRYYRKKRGFTLEALGEDIGVDKARMHKIERGQNLTLLTLLRLSAFLEVTIAKLIDTDIYVSCEDTERYVKSKQTRRSRPKKAKKVARKK